MKISLKIKDTSYPSEAGGPITKAELSGMGYSLERNLNRKGEVVSNGPHGSGLKILTRELPPAGMLRWLFGHTRKLDGEIVAEEAGKERPLVRFSRATPVAYSLRYDAHQKGPVCLAGELEIMAEEVVTDDDVTYGRRTR
jgi:hypothetical protein